MNDQNATPDDMWTTLAHLLRPQGRKGELLADLMTDFPERFAERESVSLRRQDGQTEAAVVEAHWLPVGKNAGRIVLKFQGIDSIEAADLIAGFDVIIPHEQRAELEEDHQYIADLMDCTLLDGEHTVGIIEDVHFPTSSTGTRLSEAAPLLVVRSLHGDELLIPFAKDWIESLDVPAKRIEMRLPDGLLEING